MTTDLAAALLRDVPRFALIDGPYGPFMGRATSGEYLHVSAVSSALSRALDPAIAERAGEVVERLRGRPDAIEKVDRLRDEAADLITALLAQNAALRAERDALLTTWAESRERHLAAEAKVEKLRGALTLAANRLSRRAVEYVPGGRLFIETGEWADEARAAITEASQ